MPRIRPLRAGEAANRIAHRLTKLDKVLQIATNLGVRPYRVFLVHTYWDGPLEDRGEGNERLVCEREILPTPEVLSLDQVSYSLYHAGTVPVGSVKLQGISGRAYNYDSLTGRAVAPSRLEAQDGVEFTASDLLGKLETALSELTDRFKDRVPQPFEFFYELREDDRSGSGPTQRWKFQPLNYPLRRPDNIDWTIMLERVSGDRDRLGRNHLGPAGSQR